MVGYFSYTASMSSMVEHRYGKSSLELGSIKMSFIDDNNQLLDESLALNSFYTSQPERKVCKICDSSLIDSPVDLTSHGVQYKICKNCGHLVAYILRLITFMIIYIQKMTIISISMTQHTRRESSIYIYLKQNF